MLLPDPEESAAQISKLLSDALGQLIHLAGGWKLRPATRRLAFESTAVRSLSGSLRLFGESRSILRRELDGVGPLSCRLHSMVAKLRDRDLDIPDASKLVMFR